MISQVFWPLTSICKCCFGNVDTAEVHLNGLMSYLDQNEKQWHLTDGMDCEHELLSRFLLLLVFHRVLFRAANSIKEYVPLFRVSRVGSTRLLLTLNHQTSRQTAKTRWRSPQ